VKTKFKLLLP
jgi:hypothetical protein